MWPVDEITYSVRQNTHGNLSTNVILGIILIAAVGDAATCSPTGSKLQRVPADLLDMWAICLLVVALVSLHLIHMQTHTHTDCCYAHVCIHTYTIVLHLHHRTHRSPLNVTHCVCVEGWYRVLGFSLNRASLFFLRDKVQGQSCEVAAPKEHREKCWGKRGMSLGLIALIAVFKHTQNLDRKLKPQFNLYIIL